LNADYGEFFRDAYALLHGGRGNEGDDTPAREPGEALDSYLARTRVQALGAARKRALAADPPDGLVHVHRLLLDLLSNAMQADEALAEQVKAYQCGQFNESVAHSDRLQQLVVESQRLDRDLIAAIRALPPELRDELSIDTGSQAYDQGLPAHEPDSQA
jgi:hypothetical protein